MSQPVENPLEGILRHCAAAEPQPWYPSQHARQAGIDRDSLDPDLEKLRVGGLIRLTDWVQGLGQGYVLTEEGKRVLEEPKLLTHLRDGQVAKPKASSPAAAPVREGDTSTWDRGEAVREALLNQDAPARITRLLLIANVIVYLLGMYLAGEAGLPLNDYFSAAFSQEFGEVLRQEGAIQGLDLLRAQWWRLITYAFVHIGLLHLGMNMFVLYTSGPIVERMWGSTRYLAVYLMAALGGGCAAMMIAPRVIVAGASGALCGLLASILVWIVLNRHYIPGPLVSAWLRNLFINFVIIALFSSMKGVSWQGHLGGAIVGAAGSVLLNIERFSRGWRRGLAMVALVLLPIGCVMALFGTMLVSSPWRALWEAHQTEMFEQKYLPQISKSTRAARAFFQNEVEGLLTGAVPPDPKSKEMQNLLAAVANQRAELKQAGDAVRQAGIYRSELVKEAQQTGLEYIEALDKQLELTETALQAPRERWRENVDAIREQRDKVSEAGQRWRKLLR